MPGRVESPMEILLNSVPYRIKGRVQNALASLFPRKTVSGDVKGDDQQRASTLRMADWRDGILSYRRKEGGTDAWWSTCQLRHDGHLVLPQLATLTAASGVSATANSGAGSAFASTEGFNSAEDGEGGGAFWATAGGLGVFDAGG